jgi:catechol 2,3-dioxygenase-like lactoylglutathione lyase family enzyme
MTITAIIPQLRTTDMASSIRFYTEKLGFSVAFKYQDFYIGIRAGDQIFHLKLVDEKDPSIPYVDEGEHFHLYLETDDVADHSARLKAKGLKLVKDVHETPWNTREIVIHDDQGIRCISVNLRSHSGQSRDEMSPPLAKSIRAEFTNF